VLIKPKRTVDPNDVLSAEESALVNKAELEVRQGRRKRILDEWKGIIPRWSR